MVIMKKSIVLCADDFGQAEEISEGILSLIRQNRLSATSCIVNTPDWKEHALSLKPFIDQVDIGLHFNLTLGKPLSKIFRNCYGSVFPSLSSWIVQTLLGKVNQKAIVSEFHAQLECFMYEFGHPKHIDGHEHIHQFPSLQDIFLAEYQKCFDARMPYIRSSLLKKKGGDVKSKLKMLAINLLGGIRFQKKLLQLGLPHNTDFSGIYSFQANDYRTFFQSCLSHTHSGGMILCHPAMRNNKLHQNDPIAHARWQEYQYLASEAFITDCVTHQVKISRFSDR